jgi:hypothetical protein
MLNTFKEIWSAHDSLPKEKKEELAQKASQQNFNEFAKRCEFDLDFNSDHKDFRKRWN